MMKANGVAVVVDVADEEKFKRIRRHQHDGRVILIALPEQPWHRARIEEKHGKEENSSDERANV